MLQKKLFNSNCYSHSNCDSINNCKVATVTINFYRSNCYRSKHCTTNSYRNFNRCKCNSFSVSATNVKVTNVTVNIVTVTSVIAKTVTEASVKATTTNYCKQCNYKNYLRKLLKL